MKLYPESSPRGRKVKNFFLTMAIFMLSGLLRQCSSSYENHPKFWIFLVMVRGWRRVFCYVTLDTACLKCCRPLGCLSKNESMPQVIPKLKDRQKKAMLLDPSRLEKWSDALGQPDHRAATSCTLLLLLVHP